MMIDKDHLNAILKICGTPDAEFMSKIDSEDVRIRVCICYAIKPSNKGHFEINVALSIVERLSSSQNVL